MNIQFGRVTERRGGEGLEGLTGGGEADGVGLGMGSWGVWLRWWGSLWGRGLKGDDYQLGGLVRSRGKVLTLFEGE